MKLITILTISLILVLTSCSSGNKMVKYAPKAPDTFTNSNLKTFLNSNKAVNIVLRVPNATETVTGKNESVLDRMMDGYYNAIEKELLKAGFSVRDRGLFNEVLKKMQRDNQQNIDYSQIKDLTETDLILEVIKIDPSVRYVTNKYQIQDRKGRWEEETSTMDFKKFGASAEYKIILVRNNEMAGTYKFNYAPCLDGCPLTAFSTLPKMKGLKNLRTSTSPPPYEGVEVDVMEEFIKNSTKDLVGAIKSR